MIAEFDEMVGAYMGAVRGAGVWEQTVFVVTSDHGDMQLEHRQHYKMVPREPSASVPMVIADGRRGRALAAPRVVTAPTQLIDIFPTLAELAGVDASHLPLDGMSLVPLLQPGGGGGGEGRGGGGHGERPDFVVSQFHGTNIGMSWRAIVMV